MELVDYLRVLRRRWRVIALCLLTGILAGWVTTPPESAAQQPQVSIGTSYRATHTLLQAADVQAPVNLELVRLFATTGDIPRRAAARLGQPPEEGPVLAAGVTVVVDPKVGSLAVTVSGSDGPRAAAVANAFAVEIVENLRATAQRDRDAEQEEASQLVDVLGLRVAELQRQIDAAGGKAALLEAQRDAYLENYSAAFSRLQAASAAGSARSPLVTLEQAVPVPVVASSAFSPPSSRGGRVGLAALLGLVLGVVLALVLERVDRRLRTREDVEDITSLPVVAEVPVLPRKARRDWSVSAVTAPAGPIAEAYRSLRSAITLVPSRPALVPAAPDLAESPPQVLLVTSPLPSDGKSTTVANLAACFAESGRQVLVLDCDFRNPTLHRYLGVQAGRGISDLLAGTSSGNLADMVRTSVIPGVRLVTSGTVTDHPAALLARAGGLLDAARSLADVVLIDAAPVLSANDATDLVPYVDSVVLVARSGRTTRDHAIRTTELLARLGVPIAGTALIGSNGSLGGYAARSLRLSRLLGLRRLSADSRAAAASATTTPRHSRAKHGTSPPEASALPMAPVRGRTSDGTGWPSRPHTTHGSLTVMVHGHVQPVGATGFAHLVTAPGHEVAGPLRPPAVQAEAPSKEAP